MTAHLIACLPGDGIGPEVVAEAVKVLTAVSAKHNLTLQFEYGLAGGAAYDAKGHPLPQETIDLCDRAEAILFGAVGGPKYDKLSWEHRPEAALLGIRKRYEFFANLRPILLFPPLADASPLKNEIIAKGVDIMILRELTGGIYFGEPRGIETLPDGSRRGINTEVYSEAEVRRLAHVGFQAARGRRKYVVSTDKANVMESGRLWREVVDEVAKEYPDVKLEHVLADALAMYLIRRPGDFDVVLASNLFGDILSDEASMLTGSLGMLPSASLGSGTKGFYEPIHGSAPDITGQGLANPAAAILSGAMLLRYSLGAAEAATAVEQAVAKVLESGVRTKDIAAGGAFVHTQEFGDRVVAAL